LNFLLQPGRPDKDTIRGDAASKPHSEIYDSTDAEHGRISDGRALLLGLAPFALREAMTWEYALAGCALAIGVVAAVPALRRVYLWCLKNYEETTQTAFLLLFIYALLSAPILIAWMLGVKP